MDLQWELNRLSKAVSPDSVDGATGVRPVSRGPDDRSGVHARRQSDARAEVRSTRTRHVGDARRRSLSIQNDLGAQSLHVFVVHVRELIATVIYSDTHRARLRFFHDMLARIRHPVGCAPGGRGREYERTVGR